MQSYLDGWCYACLLLYAVADALVAAAHILDLVTAVVCSFVVAVAAVLVEIGWVYTVVVV